MYCEQFTFFFKHQSPFSQWYLRDFTVKEITFNCCEQFMMYSKAMLFNDKEIANKILNTTPQKEQKALGRKVKNFNKQIWNEKCKKIVYLGNFYKFTQNKDLWETLLSTEGTTLVEASPYDRIWGIGLSEDDPRAQQRETWLGTNYLGEILTILRKNLLKNK